MRYRPVVVVVFIVVMFGSVRESHALLRWLDKLSGPGPFVGLELKWRTDQEFHLLERGIGFGVMAEKGGTHKTTFGFSLGLAASYENDLDYGEGPGVDSPTVGMMTVEAAYEVWPLRDWEKKDSRANLFLSGGVSLNTFFGSGFGAFVQPSVVARVGWRWSLGDEKSKAIEVGVEGHYYVEEFENSDFGAVPGDDHDRFVPGFFGYYYW